MTYYKPQILFWFTTFFLIIGYAGAFVSDFCHNINLVSHFDKFTTFYFFTEAGPIEILQHAYLALGFVFSAGCLAYQAKSHQPTAGWWALAAGFLLLYLEDAHNTRHYVAGDLLAIDNTTPVLQATVELSYYAFLASGMVLALFLLLRSGKLPQLARRLFLIGYPVYGLIAFASATRNVGDWYRVVGSWIQERLIEGRTISLPWSDEVYTCTAISSFEFMDGLVEESIELIAATLLLAAVLYCFQEYRKPFVS
ncbi:MULTISPECIES: hypothetical protein [unclassified Halorhodospira]|uniref:hypothetical protein n=1 Tax=unclassified Halorhodospira TaxID=2626748 RepID=UPI001EE8294D|nr:MULTISPECIES: hypothetical protein [unclassified Halorhodospira]MCG5541949.1 hypothetical protein [Halorhodospira sp. M39old]MCG5547015.1 hypothetical protein [Halorhodospira sp. M38]